MNDNNFRSSFEGKRKSLKFIASIWSGGFSLLTSKTGILYLVAVMLFLNACVEGFESDVTFTSDVQGAQLESPDAANVTFTPSADGSTVTIEWPVVYGAGGYQFSLYIVDDPENPVAVGTENEFIDGVSATRDLLEDTKYLVELKALGNEKYNNAEATSATSANFDTFLEATIIPDGSDLTQYFTENPIVDNGVEIGYELEAGGTYTVSGDINFGTASVTLRGNKFAQHPKVTMSAGFKSQGGGAKFKWIDFECSGIPTDGMFFGFAEIPEGAALVNSAVMVTNPIVFQSCNFEALPAPLYWDNGNNYVPYTLLIKDCVAEMTDNGRVIYNSASNGGVKDFTATNSTFYTTSGGSDYWMQLAGTRLQNFGIATGGQTYSNCTFYGFNRMHNSNNYSRNYIYVTVKSCIFLDMLDTQTARRILPSSRLYTPENIVFDSNTYWNHGVSEDYGSYDKSGTTLDEDPMCADPANGDFTVGNPNTVARGIGDPRWLSVQ